ncbi:hypothetical protein, partial [Bacteroides thetaiotaomicron]|uniref:hypothetical protein n=2 Tax=Bacteroides thetaiotaomicron TaxID=818 RepID=UPI001EE0063A
GMTGISLSGYMPYMTVASLEMSDEPNFFLFVWKDNEINASRDRNLLQSTIKLSMIDSQILLLLRKMQQ